MLEYVENAGTEYIETGCASIGDIKRYAVPIYGCRWYEGEKLIKDYKPCKNAEGVEGMYDTIAGEFLDRDSFAMMMLEHYMRADKMSVRTVVMMDEEEEK